MKQAFQATLKKALWLHSRAANDGPQGPVPKMRIFSRVCMCARARVGLGLVTSSSRSLHWLSWIARIVLPFVLHEGQRRWSSTVLGVGIA